MREFGRMTQMIKLIEPEDYGLIDIKVVEDRETMLQIYSYRYRMIDGSEVVKVIAPQVYSVNFVPRMRELERWFEKENEGIKNKINLWNEKVEKKRNKRFLKGNIRKVRKL